MSAPLPPPPFEPYLYTRAPAINLASGIVLAQALVAACPKIDKMRLTASNKRGSNAEAELPTAPPAAPGVEATEGTKADEK